ncbi:dienelactone hydrolase [Sphingomonas sp. UYAg733]
MQRFWFAGLLAILLLWSGSVEAQPVERPAGTTSRDATIVASDHVLAATLYRPPDAKGMLPAVVIVHGSGPVTRDMASFWVNSVLRAGGFAVLVYDKRGTGKSTGVYPEWDVKTTPKMFSDLASDAEEATRWLARQPGIDPHRLGLMGGSQAGWIMPLAASREPMIRFLFIGEGVPLPAGIEEIHSTYLDAVATYGQSRPSLRQIDAADALAEDYIGDKGYDPASVLRTLEVPVMWTYGLYDEAIPTHLSIDRIGQLQKAGRGNFEIHIFPFGDHNFYNVFSGARYDLAGVIRAWSDRLGITHPGYRSRPSP